ncbi:DivIVA domain-containing protein [Gordonia sp. VNK21]|uniref:DivIVA domain-containing protein n=1 Tax=Gordonia sp. VNK21 TaxID=3382483 RepID=UPI0038D42B5E
MTTTAPSIEESTTGNLIHRGRELSHELIDQCGLVGVVAVNPARDRIDDLTPMSSDQPLLPAEGVYHIAISKPPVLQRGYHEDQVDAFLDALEAKFRDPADPALAHITPDQVRRVRFSASPMGQRGYHPGEVDEFLGP